MRAKAASAPLVRMTPFNLALPERLKALINAGIVDVDPRVRRRHRFANVASYALGADALLHLVVNSLHDFGGLATVNVYNALAGIAFTNASLGLVHSMAHKIGGEFGITHGLANAIMLPYIIQYNAKFTKKYRQLEAALGIKNLIEAINALNQRLGVPKTLSQCDEVEINEVTFVNVLDRMSRHAVDDPCTLTNPNYPSVQDVKGLYTQAFYGA